MPDMANRRESESRWTPYRVIFSISCAIFVTAFFLGIVQSLKVSHRLPHISNSTQQDELRDLINTGKYKAAIPEFRMMAVIDPNSAEPWLEHLAIAAREVGDIDNEIFALRRIIDAGDPKAVDCYNLSTAYLKRYLRRQDNREDLKDSIRIGVRAVEIDPDYAAAHVNVGAAWLTMGELDKAEPHLREALRIDPNLKQAEQNLQHIDQQRMKARPRVAP